jgi:hypothetical protein
MEVSLKHIDVFNTVPKIIQLPISYCWMESSVSIAHLETTCIFAVSLFVTHQQTIRDLHVLLSLPFLHLFHLYQEHLRESGHSYFVFSCTYAHTYITFHIMVNNEQLFVHNCSSSDACDYWTSQMLA